MDRKENTGKGSMTRRDFIKSGTAVSLAAAVSRVGPLFAAGSDTLRVGLIGCGGRGTGAAINCVESSPGIVIRAMGDLFQDHWETSLKRLTEKLPKENLAVVPETCFSGFDAYRKVIDAGVDMVILASPPHFRPRHFRAAVEAGKHVFMEKPVAVDPPGVRSVMETAELARKKGLAVVAGTQRRHQAHYLEIMKRVHAGDIGEIRAGQCYWNQGALWVKRVYENWVRYQSGEWTDMEWQIRNWLFFTWLSGDHIVEQHVHNLDVMNWYIGSHPLSCTGMGGRQVRTGPEFGNIYDHFAVEYEYPGGVRVLSMCRQIPGCADNVSERVLGTTGTAVTSGANGRIEGAKAFLYEKESPNPYVQEHADLVASIRAGRPLNEAKRVAESTLTAIMGRMSAYTGRSLSWDWAMNASKLDLSPPRYAFGDLPVAPVAVPGKTELV